MGICISIPSGVLQGLHGVKIAPKFTYCTKNTHQTRDFDLSTTEDLNYPIQQIQKQQPPCPKAVCCNHYGDRSIMETIANVITSLPFIFLGFQAPRKTASSVLYANSLIGVGLVSSLYHFSRGAVRKIFRWADYTTIAATSMCLSTAVSNDNPKLLMAASALVLPFQPLVVSTVHTGVMEIKFAKRALSNRDLRTAHNMRAISSVLAGLLFVFEDQLPQTPYIHAAWHLAAAVGVGTCNKLLG
ncbi:hypothetical protein DsansV1_C02g0015861 [Dioscorea sansibarensis]